MQPWDKLSIVAVIALTFNNVALASASTAPPISSDKPAHLAPLVEACYPGASTCDKIEGKYLVSLRDGYTPSSHLSYISENVHVDPVKEWNLIWIGDEHYTVYNVSNDFLELIRQDPGVEEVEEEAWIVIDEVDRCQDPRYSPEEKRVCYEEKDLPLCQRPSLSEAERRDCYVWLMGLSCEDTDLSEEERRSCHEATLLDPCQNPTLSDSERQFCRDGSLISPCNDSLLSEEGRQACAGDSRVEKSNIPVHGGSEEL
jgi:hypothetical protein